MAESQSQHSLSWDDGPSFESTFPTVTFPAAGPLSLFERNVPIQTPIPGVVVDLYAAAEAGLSITGGISGALQKTGEDSYSLSASGTVSGNANIRVQGAAGLAVGVPGLSLGVAGNLAATINASLSGSINLNLNYSGGAWTGSLEAPLQFTSDVTVTPSVEVYANVPIWGRASLVEFEFGAWTIASVGINWAPGCTFSGEGVQGNNAEIEMIGPNWGPPPSATTNDQPPPEPRQSGGGRRRRRRN